MCRDTIQFYFAWIRAGCMEECASCTACLVDGLLSQYLVVVAVIRILLADHINESSPAASNANNLIAFTRCANGNRPNRRVETRNITTARQYADDTFVYRAHNSCLHR